MFTTSPCARRAHRNCSAHRRINVGVSQAHCGLILLRHRILQICLRGSDRALRRIRLVVRAIAAFRSASAAVTMILLRLHCRLRGFQIRFRLHALLVGSDSQPSPAQSCGGCRFAVRSSVACACTNCAFADDSLACALATSLVVDPEVDCSVCCISATLCCRLVMVALAAASCACNSDGSSTAIRSPAFTGVPSSTSNFWMRPSTWALTMT